MSVITAATMVQDSYVAFSPTAYTSTGGTYTFPHPVDDKFFIYVDLLSSTNAQTTVITISAGSTTVAWRRDIGSLAVTLTSSGGTNYNRALIGPLESARFQGSTGAITITLASSTNCAGFIGVAKMPYTF